MTEHLSPAETEVPPAGEEVHLPGPSLIPVLNAAAFSVAVIGLAVWLGLTVIGGIVFVWTLVLWIRDTRRDVSRLPLEHH